MNEAQTVFTIFFAISWGIVSNVLPRWKPFHCAMLFHHGFFQPTYRFIVAFATLNVVPWVIFVIVLFLLRGPPIKNPEEWTLCNTFLLIPRSILPGLVPFGFYRLWVAIAHSWPRHFYAESNTGLPAELIVEEVEEGGKPLDPTMRSLGLRGGGVFWKDFAFAAIYISFFVLAAIRCKA